MKKTVTVIVIILFISIVSYFSYDSYSYNKRVFNDPINSHIAGIVKDRARYKLYYFRRDENHFRLKINEDISVGYDNFFYNTTFNIEDQLAVGDSISKLPNSLSLQVYKENGDNKRVLYKTFTGNNK